MATRRTARVSAVSALSTLTIGIAVIVGWATGIEPLKGLVPGLIVMIPNTAVAFIAASASLWLQRPAGDGTAPSQSLRRVLARILGALTLTLGALTFLERTVGWDFGIDLILFADQVRQHPFLLPGRMEINSTICFSLAGAALLLLDHESRDGARPSQWLAATGLAVSTLALTGYLFRAPAFYTFDRGAGMALLTAIAFTTLNVGILFARPTRGVVTLLTGSDLGAMLVRGLLPATLFMPIALGWLWLETRQMEWFGREGGLAMFVVLNIVVLMAMVLQGGRALRDADLARTRLLASETEAHAAAQRLASELREQAVQLHLQTEEARTATADAENARRHAVEASRAKETFLATMSHELRTPLNAIMGYTSLMRDEITGPLNDDQRRQLARVAVSSRHLLALIDEVLTLSRVEAGKEMIASELLDVKTALDEAANMIEPIASAKGITFSVAGPDVPLVLQSDSGKVRQILVNLLSNAVKFTDRGEVALLAREHGGTIRFEVRDTGIGIAREDIEKIFEPFWQVDGAVTRRASGTGLGLAVSRRLARLLGGDVDVESEPGRGSRFTLTLPLDGNRPT